MGVLGGALCFSAYRFGARALGRRALGLRASASSAIGSPLPRAAEHGRCIYLDYQATSPVWPEVAEAAIPYLTHHWGNPSSGHAFGRPCATAVSHARSAVAQLIGAAHPDEIIFTGCGSEADNHAILGVIEDYEARQRQGGRGGGAPLPHVVTSNIEHPAITECLEALRAAGRLEVSYVPVDEEGRVAAAAVAAALTEHTVLVTVMLSNNEVG
jgi:cysteine desulfurase